VQLTVTDGQAEITVSAEGKSGSLTIQVLPVPVVPALPLVPALPPDPLEPQATTKRQGKAKR